MGISSYSRFDSLDFLIQSSQGDGMSKYENSVFKFVWLRDCRSETNSQHQFLSRLNAQGWRLIQVLESRTWDAYITRDQEKNGAWVRRYDKDSDYEKTKYYGGIAPYPIGQQIEYHYYMEREIP